MSAPWEVMVHRKHVARLARHALPNARLSFKASRSGFSLNVYRGIGYRKLLVVCLPLENDCVSRKALMEAVS